jgi:MATE family multidrug resistance protein
MYLIPKEVADMAAAYMIGLLFSLIPVIMYQGYKQFADGLAKQIRYILWLMWCMFFF